LLKTKGLALLILDASWTPKPENRAFGLHLDSTVIGSTRALTRAVVIPFLWTSGDDNKFVPIYRMPAQARMLV
jgi:hypothetical protein